jgi:hypothetical protein
LIYECYDIREQYVARLKRLEKGRFSWPLESSEQGRVRLSHEELALLLGGIELCQTQRKNWYRKEELISNKVEEKAGV